MATLREIQEFIADIEGRDPEGRSITQQDLADVLQSLAKVAGTLVLNDPTDQTPLAQGWNRMDGWSLSFDTQGVVSGLTDPTDPGGYYTINVNAAGDYTCSAMVRFVSDIDGLFEMRIAKRDTGGVASDIQFQDAINVVAGETAQLNIASGLIKGVGNNDRLQLEVKGPNGAVVTAVYAQFGVQR